MPDGRRSLVVALDSRDRYVFDNETGEPRQTCSGAWLSGVHTGYITIGDTTPENRSLVVQFAPGGSMPFTHESADRFCDKIVPASEVFGPDIDEVRSRLASSEPTQALATMRRWLEVRFEPTHAPPPPVRDFVRALLVDPADCRPTEFVDRELDISHKHFIHLFRRHVGPTPKVMQRILRFWAMFISLHENPDVDWSALSHDLGFARQAHFIREFQRFSGSRTSAFRADGHDRIDFFPEPDPESRGKKSPRPPAPDVRR